MKPFPVFTFLVLLVAWGVCFAEEWKNTGIPFPLQPTFPSTSQNAMAVLSGRIYNLALGDSVWRFSGTVVQNGVSASDSFFYTSTNKPILFDSGRAARLPPISDLACCPGKMAEDAKRLFFRGFENRIYYSEKSSPAWKPWNPMPQSSEGYSPIPFQNHYLLIGLGELLVSRNRGETWEPAKGFTSGEFRGSTLFAKSYQGTLYVSFLGMGTFRSSDQGQTWERVFSGIVPNWHADWYDMHLSGDTILLASYGGSWHPEDSGFWYPKGILRSVDRGQKWEWLNRGLPRVVVEDSAGPVDVEWIPTTSIFSKHGELWTTASAEGKGIPYRSLDVGQTWHSMMLDLDTAGSYFAENIGEELKLRGDQVYYSLDRALNRWMVDSQYSPPRVQQLRSQGDTVYAIGQEGYVVRKIGTSGEWEKRIPTVSYGDAQYYPNGDEWIRIYQNRFEFSDDSGRTWSGDRPFLPQLTYQSRKVEARGRGVYWPDDSTFGAPKVWHVFADSLRKIWLWKGGVLAQAGKGLYLATQSGGAWEPFGLPDSNATWVVKDNQIQGYSANRFFLWNDTLKQWISRETHFPRPKITSLAKFGGHLVHASQLQLPVSSESFRWQGIAYPSGKQSQFQIWTTSDLLLYACDSYLLRSAGGNLDTVSLSQVGQQSWWSFPGIAKLNPGSKALARAIFAHQDKIVLAQDQGKLACSRDRGKTWNTITGLPNITSLAGDDRMLLAVADSTLHVLRDTGTVWVSAKILARPVLSVAGRPENLAVIASNHRIQVSIDTGKTWTVLPPLPPGQMAIPTAIAVNGEEVMVGTQEHGVFIWGEETSVPVKRDGRVPGQRGAAKPGKNRPFAADGSHGWRAVIPHSNQSVNAMGQWQNVESN
jgi:hypothetical protein